MFRTAFIGSQCGKGDLKAVAHIHVVGPGAGRLSQAYQVQEAIPDRHGGDNIRTNVLSSRERDISSKKRQSI